jgi:hypothetical protein
MVSYFKSASLIIITAKSILKYIRFCGKFTFPQAANKKPPGVGGGK